MATMTFWTVDGGSVIFSDVDEALATSIRHSFGNGRLGIFTNTSPNGQIVDMVDGKHVTRMRISY